MDLEKVLTAVGKEDLKIFTYELMSGKEALVDSFLSVNHPIKDQGLGDGIPTVIH